MKTDEEIIRNIQLALELAKNKIAPLDSKTTLDVIILELYGDTEESFELLKQRRADILNKVQSLKKKYL